MQVGIFLLAMQGSCARYSSYRKLKRAEAEKCLGQLFWRQMLQRSYGEQMFRDKSGVVPDVDVGASLGLPISSAPGVLWLDLGPVVPHISSLDSPIQRSGVFAHHEPAMFAFSN